MTNWIEALTTSVRGRIIKEAVLAPYTWFRVGGAADALFLPADADDLAEALKGLPETVDVTVLGVGSNVIIRDGGVRGLVVRLAGKAWAGIEQVSATELRVGAGALDAMVAKRSAELGIAGLEFLSGVPGTIGGALRMNAGCYGGEIAQVLVSAHGVTRRGMPVSYTAEDMGFSYRHTSAPEDVIFTHAIVKGAPGNPDQIAHTISGFQARRETSQPIRDKTGGSTFANPDPPGTANQRRSWELIDRAGMRGARLGGAQVSEKHCNFLINADQASAADIEALGEKVREAVRLQSGVELRWEIKRIGQPEQ